MTLSVTANNANILDNKLYVIYAIASNGLISAPSAAIFATNFNSLSTPTIVSVSDNTRTPTVVVSGGAAGDTVSLYNGTTLLATSIFPVSGSASLTSAPLSNGSYQLIAIITDSNGIKSNPSMPYYYTVE